MFIIFGTRRMRKPMGDVMLLCQRCQRPSVHALVKLHTWFTLFFIPIFPFSIKYATACPMCGAGTQIDKARAEHLESVAAQQAAAPVEMTPDGPITPGRSAETMPTLQPSSSTGTDTHPDHAMSGPATTGSGGGGPPAAGWWMASDEKWYPPELHPDAG